VSYVLDGIETAMEDGYHEISGGSGEYSHWVKCECGWGFAYATSHRSGFPVVEPSYLDSLRFHYTHCWYARLLDGKCRGALDGMRSD
jgi:hypothetical protein